MTNLVPTYKVETEDLNVEFEVLSPISIEDIKNPQRREIILEMQNLDKQIDAIETELQKLDSEIDRLTNHADGLDYAVAIASGVITGLIDSFFGDEIKKLTDGFINNRVIDSARKQKIEESIRKAEEQAKEKGKELTSQQRQNIINKINNDYKNSEDPLKKAIGYMERQHKSPTDKIWNFNGTTITPETHHIDDLSHHASIIGLGASIVTQFTKKGYFADGEGNFIKLDVIVPAEIDSKTGELFGTTIPSKIVCGTLNWFWHLVSDVAGTSKNPGKGMGIPGPLMSLVKSFSALPGIRKTNLPKIANEMFKEAKFDFRKEVSQSIPVLINELLVRTFYAIRRFIQEYKEHHNFKDLNWKKILPFRNRTVIRMLTIATGTFTAVDIADAAIRGAVKSGGNPAMFAKEALLRVNFVGVGRFAIAIVTDVGMGIKRNHLMHERINALSQQMVLLNAKVSYKCAEVYLVEQEMHESEEAMWISAQSTEETLNEVYEIAEESVIYISESLIEIQKNFEKISQYKDSIDVHNNGLKQDIINIAKWGKK